jgi:DegV family protein with EDD domain
MSIRIVSDSTCDLPPEVIEEYQIRIIPLYINAGREQYLDGIDITREQFYTRLPDFETHPSTAVPSPQKFKAIYDSLAEEGADTIFSIHISETLSAVMDMARTAAKDTVSAVIKVLDARQLSMGTGFLVETAAMMAKAGHTVEEIVQSLNDQIKRTHVFAALDTLEYLKRSGRMNRFMSSLGSLLQIKPILRMTDGVATTEKVRTQSKAMNRIVEILASLGRIEKVAILHTHAPEKVEQLRKLAARLLPAGKIMVQDITPVIGAHLGPGAVGFAVVTAN